VPTLPLDIPRREFGVYSWLALFRARVCGFSRGPRAKADCDIQELGLEAVDDLDKFMSLDELEKKFSDRRVKFVKYEGGVLVFWITMLTPFSVLFLFLVTTAPVLTLPKTRLCLSSNQIPPF